MEGTQVGRKTPWNTMEHAEIPSATRVVKGGEKGAPALGELLQGNGPIIGPVALPLTHALGRRYSYSYSYGGVRDGGFLAFLATLATRSTTQIARCDTDRFMAELWRGER